MRDALVVVATFVNRFEAEVAQTALESAGIDSMLRSDDAGSLVPGMTFGNTGAEVLVRKEDVARACDVLRS